jgi:hypothetical protein
MRRKLTGGIMRVAGAMRRVTANAGNRLFIKGGKRSKFITDPPVFIGPPITGKAASVGVPFSYNAGQHFSGSGTYTWAGPTGGWLTINPTTGVMGGTPTTIGTITGEVHKYGGGITAKSNIFSVIVS